MAARYNDVQDVNLTTSLGGVVAAGDDVYVSRFSLTYSAGTDLSAYDLASFTIQPGSQCNFSGSGQLTLKATAGAFYNGGSGDRLELRGVNPTTKVKTIVLRPTFNGQVQQITQLQADNIVLVGGVGSLGDTVNAATVDVFGGTFIIDASGTYPLTGTLTVYSGSVQLKRDVPDVVVNGGELTIADSTVSPSGALTINGGTVKITQGGNIATLNGNAGTLDLTQNSRAFTITTANLRPGFTILKSRATVDPTITSTVQPYGPPRTVFV